MTNITDTTVSLAPLHEQMINADAWFTLILLIFFAAFIGYLLTTIANFFPEFFASITKKYKLKQNINIDYNRDLNVDHTSKILKYLTKREIKKNHGKRLFNRN